MLLKELLSNFTAPLRRGFGGCLFDRSKVAYQKILKIEESELITFVDFVRSLRSDYSEFFVRSIFKAEDAYLVFVEEMGHSYPYQVGRLENWREDYTIKGFE